MLKETQLESINNPDVQNEFDKKINYIFSNLPNLIEDNISDKLLVEIGNSIKEKRLAVFVGTHQGYIESEVWALISKRLSALNPEFNGLYLPYSEPATNSNVGKFLEKRKDYYTDNKLFLLPVVRDTDETSEKYSQYITPEMRARSRASMSKMAHASREQFAIIALPEGSIKSGRINIETGEIFGMQKPSDKTFLDLIFKKKTEDKVKINRLINNTDIIPIGIDGSYKVLSSDNYKFSEKISLWINNQEKIVTVNAKEIIPANNFSVLLSEGINVIEHLMRDKVAPLQSPVARGIYRFYNRVSLDSTT